MYLYTHIPMTLYIHMHISLGSINGDINVKSVCVRSTAVINGSITCRYLEIHPKSIVKGIVCVYM